MKYYFLILWALWLTSLQGQSLRLPATAGFISAADSIQLHYRLLGAGKDTIVVVPGGPGFGASYLIPDLTPLAAHHVLLFIDPAGAGYSSPAENPERLAIGKMVEDLETVRRYFRLQQMQIMAHSAGAMICGFYAKTYPNRVRRLLLEGPIPAQAKWMVDYNTDRKFDSLSLQILRRNQSSYAKVVRDSLKACWDYYALWARGHFATPAQARRNWGDICDCRQENLLSRLRYATFKSVGNWNLAAELSGVQAPVLVIGGDKDEIPSGAFEQWATSFPNARLLLLQDAGHIPHVDHPLEFFAAAELFFSGKFPDIPVNVPPGAGVVLPGDAKGNPYQRLRKTVIDTENRIMRFVQAAEWDSLAAVYDKQAVILAPGAPPVSGRKAIAAFWRTLGIRGMKTVELQVIDLEQSGDLLLAWGKYVMKDAQNTLLDTGKFLAQYRKTKAGWRLYSDVFNSSLETRSPLEIPDYLRPD